MRAQPEAIDTTTTGGKLVFHIFGALAEFERDLIRERTRAGLAAARARGRMVGRPRALSDAQVEMARVLLADPLRPIDEVCAALHVSRATLYRYVPTGSRPARAAPPERGPGCGAGRCVRRRGLHSPRSDARRTGPGRVSELDWVRNAGSVLRHGVSLRM